MTLRPKVAAVIVSFNSGDCLEGLLDSLSQQSHPLSSVVVVDHSPQPDSMGVAKRWKSGYLHNPMNPGYGAGINKGIRETGEPFVLCLNADISLEQSAVEEMVAVLGNHQNVAAVSATIDEEGIHERKGGTLNPFGTTVPNWFADPIQTFYPSGAAFMVRREAWESIGGMDEDFFLYGEDVNLGWRLRLGGWQVRRCPQAKASHVGQESVQMMPTKKVWFYQERNRLINYKCLQSWHTRWGYALWFIAHEVGRFLVGLKTGRAWAQGKAFVHISFSWRYLRGKWKEWRGGKVISDREIQSWFAPQWGKRGMGLDALLRWGQERVMRPLVGWSRWGWLLLIPLWVMMTQTSRSAYWPDELFTVRGAQGSWSSLWTTVLGDVHPPLFFLICWLLYHLSPLVFTLFPITLSWGAGRILLRAHEGVSRTAGWMLWLLPFTFFSGTHLRYYSLLVFFFAWLIRLGDHQGSSPLRKTVGALLCYSSHLGPIALWISTFFVPNRSTRSARRDALFSSLLWLPGLLLLLSQALAMEGGSDRGSFLEALVKYAYTGYTLSVGHYTWPDPLTPFVLFAVGLGLLFWKGGRGEGFRLISIFKIALLILALGLTWGIRIGIPFLPTRLSFMVVPVALVLAFLWERSKGWKLRPLALFFLLSSALLGQVATFLEWGPFHCGYETPHTKEPTELRGFWVMERDYGWGAFHIPLKDRLVLVQELRRDRAPVWKETEEDLKSRGYSLQGREWIQIRPASHKRILDALDLLKGEEPQTACWEGVIYQKTE